MTFADRTRVRRSEAWMRRAFLRAACLLCATIACDGTDRPVAPVLTPDEALRTFTLPPGYHVELVAAEPLVHDPVAIDFDADGRMYVVEMTGFMPNMTGDGEDVPNGKIVVLEDTDDDGRMDTRTVFADSLVLPRTVGVLERGILVGAPPFLWLMRDTTGDFRADTRVVMRDNFGSRDGNPEHNANGALWGFDNWLHSANDTFEGRVRDDGTFETRPTRSLGQWGVSRDEFGRLYRNSNEDPLRTDHIPAHYGPLLGGAASVRGVYAALTANVPVWPAHKTPAINRGYREQTLRADSTLAHYTSAGSPTAYVGDRLPADLRRSVFVTESAGNLVGQLVVDDSAGAARSAHRAQELVEFLTSTDERFRPVNLASAPDGTLYVVDMYRGIIQHRTFITGYLEQKIRERGLDQVVGFGRIYRIVHDGVGRGERPQLSTRDAAALVPALAHSNGWWRITAQRLLVERQDTSAADALRLLLRHPDERARLHALWTLDGLHLTDSAIVLTGLEDRSPHVRAAAIRVAEPMLRAGVQGVRRAVLARHTDSSLAVVRQLAASLVVLSPPQQLAAAQLLLDVGIADGITADILSRALGADASAVLTRLVSRIRARSVSQAASHRPTPSTLLDARSEVIVEALAATSARGAAQLRRASLDALIRFASDTAIARPVRAALLSGLARGATESRDSLVLATRPSTLLLLASDQDSVLARSVRRLEPRLRWPGKPPADTTVLRPLTDAEVTRMAAGREVFATTCAACHQANGAGLPGVAATLVGSPYVNGAPARLVRIVLHGKEGAMLMPGIGATMDDERVASVLSYIRREWGNRGDPIDAALVKEIRGATMGRTRAWTPTELQTVR